MRRRACSGVILTLLSISVFTLALNIQTVKAEANSIRGQVACVKEDLNLDGKVDIRDVAIWGAAFGSHPCHERWNPKADMNGDNKIDTRDAVLICVAWTEDCE